IFSRECVERLSLSLSFWRSTRWVGGRRRATHTPGLLTSSPSPHTPPAVTSPGWRSSCPDWPLRLMCPRPTYRRQGEGNSACAEAREVEGRQAPCCPQVAQGRRSGPRSGEVPGGGAESPGRGAGTADGDE